ncbi:DUF58 domain-containing protein [Desulfospira joergensenii]|uniref:DUF58 domain-containing protein n=1 Tax=Desulfospira joergensenii TaxID=53329 RepID=UPI0003B48A06|nr:DUF58 domain-containing protein [Desulfospira joergensenii]
MKVTQKHLSILPTQHGILFLAILGAMLAGSVNYNNNAGFILVFLLGGMALISLFYSFKNLMGLEITFVSAPPVFAGQKAVFHIRIHSKERDRFSLESYFPGNPGMDEPQTIERQMNSLFQVEIPAPARGRVSPRVLALNSVYPFGLFCIRARIPLKMSCLVYPSPLPGRIRASGGGNGFEGDMDTRRQGPDDFQGLTPYQPGHEVGRMAWKAVSRGQGLFIKDFTTKADRFQILDFHAVPVKDIEFRLSLLCHMVLTSDRNREIFGLKLPGKFIRPSGGSPHTKTCLRALALFGREGERP